ncbi:hypothetical protein [Providencia manganoxydans]|uniref:hypothetical protein n=1 Tax=Providencia manganoxydans TaxID=2923283 RepID=UPI0032DB7CB4
MNSLLIFVLLIIGCFAQFLSAYLINVMSSVGCSLTPVQFLLAKVKHISLRHGVSGVVGSNPIMPTNFL